MLVGGVVARLRGAERRHLEDVAADVDVHEPETAADDERAAKERLDLLGRGVGRNVEVLRRDAEEQVADGAADDERLEPFFLQPAHDGARRVRQLLLAYRVLVGRVDARSAPLLAGHEAGEQTADHRSVIKWGQRPTFAGRMYQNPSAIPAKIVFDPAL